MLYGEANQKHPSENFLEKANCVNHLDPKRAEYASDTDVDYLACSKIEQHTRFTAQKLSNKMLENYASRLCVKNYSTISVREQILTKSVCINFSAYAQL